jgi:hypothetical protein
VSGAAIVEHVVADFQSEATIRPEPVIDAASKIECPDCAASISAGSEGRYTSGPERNKFLGSVPKMVRAVGGKNEASLGPGETSGFATQTQSFV